MSSTRDTSYVFNINMLDDEHRSAFDPTKPWVFDAEHEQLSFATEDEACAAQRRYRQRHGFDQLTGERLLPSVSNDDDPAAPLHETGGQVLERVDSSTMRWDSSNGEHPIYGRADWRAEVAQDNTILGYEEWVAHQIEAENDA